MQLTCPKCAQVVGEVTAVARLLLAVHCPFDGEDFGVSVDPATQAALPAGDAATGDPPAK